MSLRAASVLWLLLVCFQFMARAQTEGQMSSDAKQVRSQANNSLGEIREKSHSTVDEEYEWRYEVPAGTDPENHLGSPAINHFAADQRAFWTAPAHFRAKDLKWIAPFSGATAAFIAADSWTSKQVPLGEVNRSKTFSDYATCALIGAGAGSFLLGHLTRNDQMSEAGFLSGEAAINSTAVVYLFKNLTQRSRPYLDNGSGQFFKGGSSFPSEHSAIAWSVASVFAHEYPGTLTKILAYGLATGVSTTRVTGQQHFPSDVLMGSALGWYFGREVYRAHHDTTLGGAPWGDVLPENSGEKTRNPQNMGSTYVPLDGWIYPAIDRLVALGQIKTAYLGIRPWTRMECARMLEEGEQQAGDQDQHDAMGSDIYFALVKEFSVEMARLNGEQNIGAAVDSIYARTTEISGVALRDGYHFGQTIINDYGRPYAKGFNSIAGFTTRGELGPFAFYARGEYQHAPAIASQSAGVLAAIASADGTLPVSNGKDETNRFDLVEAAVSVTFRNFQLSFGKQIQWLGPGESGSLLMSDNAEPLLMLKLDSVSPYRVPLLSRLLGPIRSEYFLGQVAGHQFELGRNQLLGPGAISPQPFLDGGKFSFKPLSDLELGFGFSALFAGPGLPFTFDNFLRTFYVHKDSGPTATGENPAKRTSTVDFSYRVPGLRRWLTIYGDAMTVDELSPLGSHRATVNPGIYLPQFPKLNRLQLRAEGLHEPLTQEFAPGFVYYGLRRYRSGYTNDGSLMGNWIGRAGRGAQAWLTCSFSPQTRLQFEYRLQEVSSRFIGGGRTADYSASLDVPLSSTLRFRSFLQVEQWRFPVLASTRQLNVSSGLQVTFQPNLRLRP
jgi:membrane-associated phospholipid phosphatase